MSENVDQEPQDDRGAPGSRDTGSDKPGAGPADRPEGGSDDTSDTAVAPDESGDESPNLPTP